MSRAWLHKQIAKNTTARLQRAAALQERKDNVQAVLGELGEAFFACYKFSARGEYRYYRFYINGACLGGMEKTKEVIAQMWLRADAEDHLDDCPDSP